MKRTNFYAPTLLALLASACAALAINAFAQNGQGKYKLSEIKVGDQVEIDPFGGELEKGKWYKFKVTRVDKGAIPDEVSSYVVTCYDPPAQNGNTYHPPADTAHVRPLNGLAKAAAAPQDGKTQPGIPPTQIPAAPQAAGANRADARAPQGCDCTTLKNTKPQGAPSAALFRDVIKATYDKEAKPGEDGTVCANFTNFQMGNAYQWRPELDPKRVGTERLGVKPKMVYPVKANFIVCTTYRWAWETTEWTDATFTCFKDERFGDWKCRGENGESWKYQFRRVEHQ